MTEPKDEYYEISQSVLDGSPTMADFSSNIFKAIAQAKYRDSSIETYGKAALEAIENKTPETIGEVMIAPYSGDVYLVDAKRPVSDGFHTFEELYHMRMLMNAALFNMLSMFGGNLAINIHKSKVHADGTMFEGGWFVVMAELKVGATYKQVSFHYRMEYWHLFDVWPRVRAMAWDGHDAKDSMKTIEEFLEHLVGWRTPKVDSSSH